MTAKIMEADNNLNHDELDFFIKGNISLEKGARKKPYRWLTDQGWEDIQKLANVVPDKFATLSDDIERDRHVWKEVSVFSGVMIMDASEGSAKIKFRFLFSCYLREQVI